MTVEGDITILGVGGSPTSEYYADITSVSLVSDSGSIKVEVNGGGVNAPYSINSDKGETTVEINGLLQPHTGSLGDGLPGRSSFFAFSDKGNVQVSLLASPL